MKKHRVYKSVLGVPVYFLAGLSLFILFSAFYDFVVGDRNGARYFLIGFASLGLIVSIITGSLSMKAVKRIINRQMGN